MRRYHSYDDDTYKWVTIIIAILITIPLLYYSDTKDKAEINKQVSAINGKIVSIEGTGFFEHDPLPWGGKGSTKYKFKYIKDGELKTGYVLFSWDDQWIMDYKE